MMSKLEFSKGHDLPVHEDGGATAGINVTKQIKSNRYPYDLITDIHYNRIEVYGKTEKDAQTLRSMILAALERVEIME